MKNSTQCCEQCGVRADLPDGYETECVKPSCSCHWNDHGELEKKIFSLVDSKINRGTGFGVMEFCRDIKDLIETEKAVSAGKNWKEMKEEMMSYLNKGRELEVAALEASQLVPDRHYHKGKIHLIDDIKEHIN